MKIDQQHFIKTVRYDIQFNDKESAHQLQNSISRFHTSKVNTLLNTILNTYSEEEVLHNFDTVELNLGNIDPSNYEQEIFDRIEEVLTAFLTENNAEKTETHDSKIAQLEYFLLYGHFPWNTVNSETPDLLLKNIILTNSNALRGLLIKFSKNQTVHKRLVSQFSKETFEKMVKQIGGETGNAIVEENNKKGIIGSNSKILSNLFKHLTSSNIIEDEPSNNLEQTQNQLYITSAGLIIMAPYLGMLFDKCDLLIDGVFKNKNSQFKAIQLLNYSATSNEFSGEHELAIHKILCGLELTEPVENLSVITENERAVCDSLLAAITEHWTPLNNTSIDGLRTTFLQRDGRLEENEDAFFLQVEQKSWDMLLDQIPWNITKIKLSWMPKTLDVQWR